MVQGAFGIPERNPVRRTRLDAQALRRLKPELELFLERYAPLFGRDEAQAHANRFVQGLLLGDDRRSAENIAEAIAGCVVRSLQKFLAQSPWPDDDLLAIRNGRVGTGLVCHRLAGLAA